MKKKSVMILLSMALIMGACGQENAQNDTQNDTPAENKGTEAITELTGPESNQLFSDRDKETDYDEEECIKISLNKNTVSYEEPSVSAADGTVTITKKGTYLLSGTWEGSILIDVGKEDKVQLILDGADISANTTAAVYVKEADKVFLTLAGGSSNKLKSTGEFVNIDDNNIDGTVFSKADLTVNGEGTLEVTSETGHGIVGKDDLVITGGTVKVESAGHGLSGKDSVRISGGVFDITCGKDGIHSGNDEDEEKGYVYIGGGEFMIAAEDDGIHAENRVVIEAGNINITKSYEGIEGRILEFAGGTVSLTSKDDGLNATDGSTGGFGFGKMGGGAGGTSASLEDIESSNILIKISGGQLNIRADGDGIDSNGCFLMTGGAVYVSGPQNSGNGALDFESQGAITGGTIVAAGASGMAMNFGSASTQGSIMVNSQASLAAGTVVTLKDSRGNELVSYVPAGKYNSVVISCPEIKVGETYTVTMGEETQTVTMEELIYGSGDGFGRGNGGFGNKGGFNWGDFGVPPETEFGTERGDKKGDRDFGGLRPGETEDRAPVIPDLGV